MHYVDGKGLMPRSEQGLWRHAQFVSRSGLAPYSLDTPEKVYVAMAYGLEIGFTPMVALTSVCVINGFPSLYGDGPLAMIERSGLLESIDERIDGADEIAGPGVPLKDWPDDIQAVCTVKRKDRAPRTFTYSVADAKQAGLWEKKGRNGGVTPWITSPLRMLKFRARGFALRDTFPDALKGFRQAEEVMDYEIVDTQAARPVFDPSQTAAAKTSGDALADKLGKASPPPSTPPPAVHSEQPPEPAPAPATQKPPFDETPPTPAPARRSRRRVKDDQPSLQGGTNP